MFRPPVNRAMRTLDRSFFRKSTPIAAARVYQNSEIAKIRQALMKSADLLSLPRMNIIRDVKGEEGVVRKALLLREGLKHDGR